MAGKLIIICGLPGAGKTTHAKTLEQSLRAIRFCADDWIEALNLNLWDEMVRAKVEALQWTLAKRFLAMEQTILIEWGTWAKSERDALREEARALGATVELHFLSEPVDVLFERIQRRGAEQPVISREQLDHWGTIFNVPTEQEVALYDRFWSNKPR